MKILTLQLLITILLLGYTVHAAPINSNSKSNNPLLNKYINSTVTSSSGYLYIATKKGISKYDGYHVIDVYQSTTIGSNLQLKDSFLYFHNTEGLIQLNTNTDQSVCLIKNNFKDSDPNNDHFQNIFIDSKRRIWGSDFNTIKYYSPSNDNTQSFLLSSESKTMDTYSILEPKENEIWIGSKNGLYLWNAITNNLIKHPNNEVANLHITAAIKIDASKILLATITGDIYAINPINNSVEKYAPLPQKAIPIGFIQQQGKVYVYTAEHLLLIANNHYETIFNADKSNIHSIHMDQNTGKIWIATDKGLVTIPPLHPGIKIIQFDTTNEVASNVISIVPSFNKYRWALTDNGKVWQLIGSESKLLFQNSNLKPYCLNAVSDKLLLSTDQGMYAWKGNAFTAMNLEHLLKKEQIIKVLQVAPQEVWVVYAHQKIQRYSWPNLELLPDHFTNADSFWKDNQWNDIIVDHSNQIWLAGWMPKGFGINLYDKERRYFQDISDTSINKNPEVFVGDYYNRIGLDYSNNILFAAYGGFNKVDKTGSVIQKIDIHQYPHIDAHIEGISEDKNGNVFFATSDGLFIYRKDTEKIVRISMVEGLPTDNLTNAYAILPDDEIAIGIPNGIAIINPENILKTLLQNKLVLSQIKINGKIESTLDTFIELSKDQTDITFYFSNLSFLDPLQTSYQYRFDDEEIWQDLGPTPELSMNHIAPGTYHIHIRTLDNLYNIQEKTLEITLLAKPPFLKSNLFYGILFLSLILLIILIQRYLSKRKQREINFLRKIKETEMQVLRSQMNPHFMFNTLNSINSYIIQHKTEDASHYLTTFSKLMRNILQNSKQQSVTLENELNALRLYIQLESVRLEYSFSYSINIDENVALNEISVPPLIIQPFVENAIWHGLRNRKDKGHLSIDISRNSLGLLEIKVEDNGVGRANSARLKNNQINHKSYGMDITKERLQMLDEDNTVIVEDLYDDQKQPIGTKIIITIKNSEND